MNNYTLTVDFKNKTILPKGTIKLVEYDYNSTVIKFNFESEYAKYSKKMNLKYPDGTKMILLLENDEIHLGNHLQQSGIYQFEIVAYDEDSKNTNYAIGSFEVREQLVKDDDKEVEIDDRLPILDTLINKTTNLENTIEEQEKIRTTNEDNRIVAENSRILAEIERNDKEQTRISNETKRVENEEKRQKNETDRIKAETERLKQEEIREENESERMLNEDGRQLNETNRENYVNDLKQRVDNGEFDGECNFATFTIEDGDLIMNKTEDLLLDFEINNKGELEVII